MKKVKLIDGTIVKTFRTHKPTINFVAGDLIKVVHADGKDIQQAGVYRVAISLKHCKSCPFHLVAGSNNGGGYRMCTIHRMYKNKIVPLCCVDARERDPIVAYTFDPIDRMLEEL